MVQHATATSINLLFNLVFWFHYYIDGFRYQLEHQDIRMDHKSEEPKTKPTEIVPVVAPAPTAGLPG